MEPTTSASRRVFIETFGCQMNVLDSELVRDQLLSLGYRLVPRAEEADVVLFNTCAVREQSEQKVLSRLGVMGKRKKHEPDLVVGMLGCMAERTGAELQRALKHLDVVVGPSELDRLPELLAGVAAGQGPQRALSGHAVRRSRTLDAAMDRLEALDQGRLVDPDQAGPQRYVRITRGCNKMCSFCIVPFTRGPETHRDPDAIVAEVGKLVDAGAVEVTLLGQTINHYRHGDTTFAQLLARVHDEVPTLPRLRFLTSYPRDFTDDTLAVMASRERICRFLHVPAQSGSDSMLRKMNRGYTTAEYLDLVRRAREHMPDVAIVGDMIVGYPSESDADFEASLELLRAVRYKTVYIFKYSERPGTVASSRDADDVPDDVKRARNQAMLGLQHDISLQHHQALVGQALEVLVEGTAKLDPAAAPEGERGSLVQIGRKAQVPQRVRLTSRTRGDHIVSFTGAADLVGKLVTVRVTRATPLSLSGELATP
ncbi:MAG: tRNA (N6-isopentenyl adenosine(37)-C2)-methylthiotransferase MiaB [Deltaproteobacteria bacterium]|nr:tRNA (N6-isopentenyl adenosine(37)-C2)-methylthiotransferase MiaB [Deltaproteobacteria bacterium]